MLFISEDKTKFTCTTEDGAPCFTRGQHVKLAKEQGLDLSKLDNLTMAHLANGKGVSVKEFLNKD